MLVLYEALARSRGVRAEELTRADLTELWRRALPIQWRGYEVVPGTDREDPDAIVVVDYDARWPERFESWNGALRMALGDVAVRIAHVGSTAVPGLAAKPIVDVNVAVRDLDDEAAYAPAIESLGVQLRSRDDQHRYFRPFAGRPRDVHVHVATPGGVFERRHLLFVDYLRATPQARDRYVATKRAAASRWPHDRLAYTEAKTDVIAPLMAEAERWAAATGWAVESRPIS